MARRWLRAVIAMMVQKLGLSSPRPVAAAQATAEAQSLVQQGIALDQKGSCAEAEQPFERSLAIREKALGPEHPDVARGSQMRLICYPTTDEPPQVVPASAEREWMDFTDGGFAYRCLPLNIANAYGWVILNPVPFIAHWTGERGVDSVEIQPTSSGSPLLASSHFGCGVLTFHVNALFRTEAGYDLLVTGPFNEPKDGIQPLTGIIEADWAPFTFTMNWKFTRKKMAISFGKNEPFCMIFPIRRNTIEQIEPELRAMASDPELHAAYSAWAENRRIFNTGLKVLASEAQAQKWQKDYFRGSARFGAPPPDHRTKLRVREFAYKS